MSEGASQFLSKSLGAQGVSSSQAADIAPDAFAELGIMTLTISDREYHTARVFLCDSSA